MFLCSLANALPEYVALCVALCAAIAHSLAALLGVVAFFGMQLRVTLSRAACLDAWSARCCLQVKWFIASRPSHKGQLDTGVSSGDFDEDDIVRPVEV